MGNKKDLNKFFIKGKKGGEKWLSIWWFLVLVIIGGAIAIGVLIYYNSDVNIKRFEADILAERIARCLIENGKLDREFLKVDFDVFEACNLKKEAFGQGSNFYFKISFKRADESSLRADIQQGNLAFEKECGIESVTQAKEFPRCSYKDESFFYLAGDGKEQEGKIQITAGSNQEIKRVSLALN
jgi:hypothetical protein